MGARDLAKIVVILGVIVVIGIYSYSRIKNLISGPLIEIISPINGSLVQDSLVEVTGITKNISKITLNGRPITINQEGKFGEQLVVPLGYNIISVEGTDRFGKKKLKTIQIVRESATTTEPKIE